MEVNALGNTLSLVFQFNPYRRASDSDLTNHVLHYPRDSIEKLTTKLPSENIGHNCITGLLILSIYVTYIVLCLK